MSGPDAQRIDKWLWHARFARTRAAAQQLATSGHVRVNRDKVAAASRLVRSGDVLTLALDGGVRIIRIRGITERRGSFPEAQQLYEEENSALRRAAENDVPMAAAPAASRPLNPHRKADTPRRFGRVRSKP